MKKFLCIVALIALSIGSYNSLLAQSMPTSMSMTPGGIIEVSGYGMVMVDPNEFEFTVLINEFTTSGRVTVAEAEKSMFQALAKVGVDKDKIRLDDMSITSEKRRSTNSAVTYKIKLNSAALVRESFAALNTLAISQVTLTSASNNEIEKYSSEARKLAVEDAQKKARELASALGLNSVNCISIKELPNHNIYSPIMMRSNNIMMGAALKGGAVEPLEFTQIVVDCNVEAKFTSLGF